MSASLPQGSQADAVLVWTPVRLGSVDNPFPVLWMPSSKAEANDQKGNIGELWGKLTHDTSPKRERKDLRYKVGWLLQNHFEQLKNINKWVRKMSPHVIIMGTR